MAERWAGFFDDISESGFDGQLLSARIEVFVWAASVKDSLANERFGRDSVDEKMRAGALRTCGSTLHGSGRLERVVEVGNAKFHKIFVRRAGWKFWWWGGSEPIMQQPDLDPSKLT